MNFNKLFQFCVAILFGLQLSIINAQTTVIPQKESFHIDLGNKLIVWHVKDIEKQFSEKKKNLKIEFGDNFNLQIDSDKLDYTKSYVVQKSNSNFKLYLSKLPLLSITIDTTTLNSDKKFPSYFKYFNDSIFIESFMGIRQRGNLSLTFPKKSYDIEFWNDTINRDKKDLKLINLRNDDDWILDALYNEPLKMRAQVATDLWQEIHKPYYLDLEPKAKSTFRADFVELFVNGSYNGLYALSESIDRKQLKLKKNTNATIRGELFKANSYDGGPAFKKAGKFNNYFPHYVGFRMEYPVVDYNSYWNNLADFLDLVVNKSDAEFSAEIFKKIDINNVIDYYLFVNTIGAGDNFGKNYYLAKYTNDEHYFFVPWDLDSSFGLVQNAKKYTMTNTIFSNNLFDRCLKVNPENFKTKLKERWKQLRVLTLSNQTVLDRFKKQYDEFTNNKIYEREALVWSKNTTNENDYEYLIEWISNKLLFMDNYVERL